MLSASRNWKTAESDQIRELPYDLPMKILQASEKAMCVYDRLLPLFVNTSVNKFVNWSPVKGSNASDAVRKKGQKYCLHHLKDIMG